VGTFGGILVIILIVLIAGLIAYIGDRVGHQVGRKRMTLFGLRPKYTSTIVAVTTGMMIALIVTVTTLLASEYARAAFFHLSDINNKVNQLQAQEDELQKQVRLNNVVVNHGNLLYSQYLLLTPQEASSDRALRLATFFDAVVGYLNRTYVPQGLKPYRGKSSDPDIAKKLAAVLSDAKVQGFLINGPVLLVAVADENLFAGDTIAFTFAPYSDQKIFNARQPIASVEVDGGTAINSNVAYGQLAGAVSSTAIEGGMPAYFANAIPQVTLLQVQATQREIRAGRGRFYIVARAVADVYPHTGGIPVTFDLSRTPK
jgi:osmotically-inducible protein OsmY